jgi:predicted dehydrogenase
LRAGRFPTSDLEEGNAANMASSPAGKVNVGIVGAGNISDIYLKNLSAMFDNINVVGIADLVVERAQDRAEKFGVGAFSVDELLAHPDVEIVLNLTIPAVHAEIAGKAIANGKSAYNEKPLATNREDGKALLAEASAQGVLVGSAPDTFLGGGLQSARKYLDDGLIGAPVAVSAQMLGHGMESWHPDPSFFFQPGAGPLFDVGVYYVQALASMIGPVARVASMARASFPERIRERCDRSARRVVRRVGNDQLHARDLWFRGNASVARSQHLRRATATAQGWRDEVDRSPARLRKYGKQSGTWCMGHGQRDPDWRGGARQRRTWLPRA